ncbi:MAG: gliding motility protein GldL [Prevotellaceae bacterium]|jgi:gliding motility-associated protein GldL|nr:gliding motility protein GldL [Prevotellaceae bacterium]
MSFFESKAGKRVMTFAYGAGAAVVIAGALFKLQHWPFAGGMLTLGMSVEAIIFIISAFEPIPKEYHWETVFPEIMNEGPSPHPHQHQQSVAPRTAQQPGGNVNFDLNIDKSTTDGLKEGIKKFSESINQMANMSSLVDAASELTGKMHTASGTIGAVSDSATVLSDSYYKGVQAIQTLNEQSKAGLERLHSGYEFYRGQLEALGHTMGALNSSYELYLQESKKIQNDYITLHGETQQLVNNINISVSETQKLGTQMASLNNNVENLNYIYGSMLTAVNSVLNK